MINTLEDLKKISYDIDSLTEYDWGYISAYQKLSEQFIEKYKDEVYWNKISHFQKLSEQFIEKFHHKVNWVNISAYQKLSETFIEKYKDKVCWDYISAYQKLSEQFIEKLQDKVNWSCISVFQKLSETFIEKYQDKVNWNKISAYQKLSETFIEKYKDEVCWDYISKYQKLSGQFIEKYKDKLDLHLINDSWYYKSTEFKKEQVVNTKLYECYKDYFIAYKGIRSDNYSKFNFQYQYFVGNIYESNADYSDDESSFGLSAWTYEKAKKYCDEKIVKVKIYYKDIARIVYNGGKIRCCKFEVLEEIL